ncbi:D-inositol-3-phosphate glycosyltransferase [Marinobacter litoralis]|uniref:D-inositol-3-phosphate glycosyltransferase n=1 Tax=Marinobacter litoralis TaxID=187981 RepID=A0A3M2RLU2_9GAMM|nr:glycosyltransferase [Marinobacter litoralis]RMJ06132.1 D-inositol-3-phosphate glycosyltransferase [Marinobacter litoralis]
MTGKLVRETLNFARELDLSGWRFMVGKWRSRIMSLFTIDPEGRLSQLAGHLAHFPRNWSNKIELVEARKLAVSLNRSVERSRAVSLSYCAVIKCYVSNTEKGILLVSFENQLAQLVDFGGIDRVLARYQLVFIPSWSGLYSKELFRLVAAADQQPVFVMPVHSHELELVPTLGANCHSLPFNAASWVNPAFFDGPAQPRDIDCLMVANFASFKRHWLLFKALKGLPKDIKVTCVGVPLGSRTAESIRQEAAEYGVSDQVTIVEDPSQEELRRYFRMAKMFCAMSYREGSFIAVAESLMSGTPVLMFSNAHIGTKTLINEKTGALVKSVRELRQKILEYRNFEGHDQVRQTAIDNISAQANSRKLNDMLRDWSINNGKAWTVDIEPFYSQRLDFHYFNDESRDRLADDYRYLSELGVRFPRFS